MTPGMASLSVYGTLYTGSVLASNDTPTPRDLVNPPPHALGLRRSLAFLLIIHIAQGMKTTLLAIERSARRRPWNRLKGPA